jgi:hypothetical protein
MPGSVVLGYSSWFSADLRVVGSCQYCQYPPRYGHLKIGGQASSMTGQTNVDNWIVFRIFRNTILPSRFMPRAIISCLITVLCASVAAQPGDAVRDAPGISSESSAAVSVSQTTSPVIVMGFLGGLVAHDEPYHPEVQLIRDLHQEYPEHVYFGLFENSKVGEAYRSILNQLLGAKENQELSDAKE